MANAGDTVRASDVTRYYCKAIQNSVQSIPNITFTAITFDGTDEVDTLGIHDPVTNNSRFVIGLKLGWWQLTGKYATAGGTSGADRRTRILLNGVTAINGAYTSFPLFVGTSGAMTGGFWTCESTTIVQATSSGDYAELYAYQGIGAPLNTEVSGDLRSQFTALYLGT